MEYFKNLYWELFRCGVYLGLSGYEVGFVLVVYIELDFDEVVFIMEKCLYMVFKILK